MNDKKYQEILEEFEEHVWIANDGGFRYDSSFERWCKEKEVDLEYLLTCAEDNIYDDDDLIEQIDYEASLNDYLLRENK